MRRGSPSTADAFLSLGALRPGERTSDSDLASAMREVSAATEAGQPAMSLFAGIHRDLAGGETVSRFPVGLRRIVSVRSSPSRAIDPLASWTRVMRPATTRGPFVNELGEQFWIDTFVLPKLSAIMAENQFGQRTLVARLPMVGPHVAGARQRLGAGTVWLPARVRARGRAADEFVGIRITGGDLRVSGPATPEDAALIVKSGWEIELGLALEHAAAPEPVDGPGADATAARVELPETAVITLGPSGVRSIVVPAARATVYGQSLAVSRNDEPPFFDEQTRSIVVPFTPPVADFGFATVRSRVWGITGTSKIGQSGWALAVAAGDPNGLGEADSAGSLWLSLDAPLAVTWRGLPVPARARRTVLSMTPGTIVVWTTVAAGAVTQELRFWSEDGEARRRSSFELESTAGSIVLHVSQPGMDGVLFTARGVGHLDRPVAADGGRLGIHMPVCRFGILDTPTGTIGTVLANDDAAPTSPHIAFALENAFIKARPPAWLQASGPLTEDGFQSGRVLLRFRFRFVLPTLPDPYASSFEVPVQRDTEIGWATASVSWSDPDTATLAFTVLPAPASSEGMVGFVDPGRPGLAASARRGSDSIPVLLDVSSNADQFGVAIPPFSGAASSLQVAGMALVAEARHVAVMTLPPISWEPMLTKTPEPGAAGDIPLPPPPDDGGPAVLTADTVELRPVAPIPLLTTYHDAIRKRRHFRAYLPLPFGLVANIDTRGKGRDAPESLFDGTVFLNQPAFGGALTGGRQLAIVGDPIMPGYLEAGAPDYAKGVLSENILEGVLTGFGEEAFTLPLRRYELSGYGATLFSDWRDPEAGEGPAIIQVRFDVLTGRTSHEVIQMQSALDPVHARCVRTITIDRHPGGWILREDSGWQPTSDGRFEFKGNAGAPAAFQLPSVHKGTVEAVVNIRNIRLDGAQFSLPSAGGAVTWQPVLYDADIVFANVPDPRLAVTAGSIERRVPSRNLRGWIQISGPRYDTVSKSGKTISRVRPATGRQISDLLMMHGPVIASFDAQLALGGTLDEPGLQFRASRMDVSCAGPSGAPHLVVGVRGSPALPRDGAWSLARMTASDTAPRALDPSFPVPIVRPNGNPRWHLADPTDILELADAANPATRYGIVHSMGTQKVFFERPRVGNDVKPITLPRPPKLADVGALLHAAGIFPGLGEAFDVSSFDGFEVTGGQIGFTKTFPILAGGKRTSAVLADLGGADAIQLVIDYEDEKAQPTIATIAVNPVASPRWSITLDRVAFSVHYRGKPLIRMFARVKADEHSAPAVEGLDVRYEGILRALQTIFTNVQQVSRYLPGGAGAGLRVAFSQGHLTIRNDFALPNLPLGAGQITDVAVAMGLEVALSPFDVRFIAGLGSPAKPFRWIVSPLAGTGVVQVGIGSKGLDVVVQGGLGLGLAIDLGIAAGSASVTLALELHTGPDPFELRAIISGRASVDVLRGLASATITLAAGLGIIPPKELLEPPFLPPSIPPPHEIPSFTIGFTASVAVGIHLTVCWVCDVDWDGYWQFRQDITTPAIPIPSPF